MQKKPLGFIYYYIKDFKYTLLFIVLLIVVARSLTQIGFYLSAKLFSWAGTEFQNPDYWQVMILLLSGFVALDLIGHLFQTWSLYISGKVIPHIRSLVIKDTFDYVNKQSISYFAFLSLSLS